MSWLLSRISGSFFFMLFMWLSILIVMASCSSTKKVIKKPEKVVVSDSTETEKLKSDDLLFYVLKNQPAPEYLTAKASVSTNIGGQEEGFNIHMRIRKDSAIWVSINALLGIEAARLVITPDSIKFMDKIHKEYKITDYEFLKEVLEVKIDFQSIQAVLLGNFFNYRNEFKFNSVYAEDSVFILSTLTKHKLKRSLEDKDPNKPVVQDFYIDPASYRILLMRIEDNKIEKAISTNYEQFKTTEAGIIPFRNKTQIAAGKNIEVLIEYTKMDFGLITGMPFNVPKGYEKLD